MPSQKFARWFAPLLFPALVGCVGSRADSDLLEARLRDQQDLVGRYERLLDANQEELTLARKESDLLRTQIAAANASPILPEQADVLLRAEKLEFHQMMTGTRDVDGRPGDEALNVVLIPQSKDGETIRLFGELEVEALDLSRPQGEQQVGRWNYTAGEARELWHSGFLASGFQLDVPWQAELGGPDVVLHARLKTADGRQFDATHQVRVDLPVVQTAASTTETVPQVEPRRIAAVEPAQPINVSEPILAPAPEPVTPELAVLEPIDRPRADSSESTANPFEAPPEVAKPQPAMVADVATEVGDVTTPPPFPGSHPEPVSEHPSIATPAPDVAPFPSESESVAPELLASQIAPADPIQPSSEPTTQLAARPVAETPFDIIPRDERSDSTGDLPAAASLTDAGSFPEIQPREDQTAAAPVEGTPFAPLTFPSPSAAVPAPVDPSPSLPASPATPFDQPVGAAPPAVPGLVIQPLAPPQRYRRAAASPTTGPLSSAEPNREASAQSALRPVPTEQLPVDGVEATASPLEFKPLPVDITAPQPVNQTSVNWTDESIPYLR